MADSNPRVASLSRGPPGIASVAAAIPEQDAEIEGAESRGERSSVHDTPEIGASSGGERTDHVAFDQTDPKQCQDGGGKSSADISGIKRNDGSDIDMIDDYYPDLLDADVPDDSSPAKGRRPATHQIVIGATDETFLGTSHQAKLARWHQRTGHINAHYLRRIAQHAPGMEELRDLPTRVEPPACTACLKARSKRKPLPKRTFKRHSKPLYMLHTDMSGKVRTMGVNGSYYFVVFADDATNYKFVSTMRTKDEFIPKLDDLLLRIGKTPHHISFQ
eukprot:1703789-Rhodomonas_salina.1